MSGRRRLLLRFICDEKREERCASPEAAFFGDSLTATRKGNVNSKVEYARLCKLTVVGQSQYEVVRWIHDRRARLRVVAHAFRREVVLPDVTSVVPRVGAESSLLGLCRGKAKRDARLRSVVSRLRT